MRKRWTEEELQYLKDNYGKVKLKDLRINGRSESAIHNKARLLNLVGYRQWSQNDVDYLVENWGSISIGTIAKNLGRSTNAVMIKAQKLGLGAFLDSGDYVTLNQLFKALTGRSYNNWTLNNLIEKGLPVKKKRVKNCSFRIVYLDDWWDWAERNMNLVDFSRLEPLALGKEPKWVDGKRKADIEKTFFKTDPWTPAEDALLKKLLNEYRYTYRDLSLRLRRTEGAIKRRVCDLHIKARPLKMSNHNPWTSAEVEKLIDLYNQGHAPDTMAKYISRSAQACRGKVERLIKDGVLFPRSECRKTC